MDKIIEKLEKLVKKATKTNNVPVACVIVNDKQQIVSCGYNKKYKTNSAMDHAEIIALRKLTKKVNDWRLNNYTMYVTLKPCPMCEKVINEFRIKEVKYFVDTKYTQNCTKITQLQDVEYTKKFEGEMQTFFQNKR